MNIFERKRNSICTWRRNEPPVGGKPLTGIGWLLDLCMIGVWALAPACTLCAQTARVDFNDEIKPLLSDRCFQCHGPDGANREADLRLDQRDAAMNAVALNDLRIITPNDPAMSELVRRIESDDPDERMPPSDSKISLSNQEIEVLKSWIKQGAPWREHWSFVPLDAVPVPTVVDETWANNDIDRFILSRLEKEGLAPASEAARERLIRRVTFDLTGLPPTLEELDAFLSDNSPDAYERVVDRLLESDQFGERMATNWLDLARYSDTYGYQVDRDRHVWPWRDWVIEAFNTNMPFDQFITWQLAGDLLPEANDEQVLATTFNRLHPQKVEGGSVPEEFRVEYVADRNHTFATAFLGLTLECSRCHDHKFDPITQKEYYQLFAFFNGIDEAGLYSYFTPAVPTPTLLLTNETQKASIAEIEQRIVDLERAVDAAIRDAAPRFDQWLEDHPTNADVAGQIAHLDFESLKEGPNISVEGKVGKGVRLSGDDGIGAGVGNFRRFDPFSVSLWINTPDVKERAVVFHRSRAWTDAGSRGYQLLIEDGALSASLIHFWPGNAIRVRARDALAINQWKHVAVTYDGSSRADGLQIFVDGKPAELAIVRDNLYKNITGGGGDNITIGERFRDRGFKNGLVDEFRVFDRQLTPIEVAHLFDGNALTAALATATEELSEHERAALLEYYLSAADTTYQEVLTELRSARAELSKLVDGIQEIMVMRELPNKRQTYVLERGAYDAPGDPVIPDTPATFPSFPDDVPRNRLGLAKWLTDPGHPLTARVAANRFWQIMFGRGLVRTPEDFGSQGQPPTHAELLDLIANDFAQHGWDVKRLLKKIAMSATYRQDSGTTAEALAHDPENQLLARGPVYRLPAEMIRDNALATAGLLIKRIGGPPVRPYEVAVSFKPVKRDEGEGLYRRSLYTFWKRTAPAPVMMSLDASKRDVCVVKRERTTSPLQALVLMNDPQLVEAARVLSEKMFEKHDGEIESMIVEIFRLLTSRHPTDSESEILAGLYQKQLAHFRQHGELAEAFLKTGDAPRITDLPANRIAALGVVIHVVMNFDGCVIKR